MRIAKPLLLITTPIGVIGAVYEAFRQTAGLGFLMLMFMLFVGTALGGVVRTIRKEQRLAAADLEIPRS
jgi:hypothetical protein